jgi:hypothetical protein
VTNQPVHRRESSITSPLRYTTVTVTVIMTKIGHVYYHGSVYGHGHCHCHDHGQCHGHGHGQCHGHGHGHGHDHGHCHGHGHGHDNGDVTSRSLRVNGFSIFVTSRHDYMTIKLFSLYICSGF